MRQTENNKRDSFFRCDVLLWGQVVVEGHFDREVFNHINFNPGLFNNQLFNPKAKRNFSTLDFSNMNFSTMIF